MKTPQRSGYVGPVNKVHRSKVKRKLKRINKAKERANREKQRKEKDQQTVELEGEEAATDSSSTFSTEPEGSSSTSKEVNLIKCVPKTLVENMALVADKNKLSHRTISQLLTVIVQQEF